MYSREVSKLFCVSLERMTYMVYNLYRTKYLTFLCKLEKETLDKPAAIRTVLSVFRLGKIEKVHLTGSVILSLKISTLLNTCTCSTLNR